MIRRYIFCIFLFVIIFNCDKNENENLQFKVGKSNIGYLTDSTLVKELKFIFSEDSILNRSEDDSFVGGINPFEVYQKNGNHLLSIFPTEALDSLSSIDYTIIRDKRYKTSLGIFNQSYFTDIKKAYAISEIKNNLNSLTIEVDSVNISFIIHKNELNRNFDFGRKISISEIPDSIKINAFIKYF